MTVCHTDGINNKNKTTAFLISKIEISRKGAKPLFINNSGRTQNTTDAIILIKNFAAVLHLMIKYGIIITENVFS